MIVFTKKLIHFAKTIPDCGQLAQWILKHQSCGVLWIATGKFVEVVVDPESGSTAGDLPSEAVAGPPKAKEVEIVRSAPRVETNYPAELLLNRKAQAGYRVLPGPRNQPTPVLGDDTLRPPPQKRAIVGEEGGDSSDTPNIVASASKAPGPLDPPPPASPIALPTKKARPADK